MFNHVSRFLSRLLLAGASLFHTHNALAQDGENLIRKFSGQSDSAVQSPEDEFPDPRALNRQKRYALMKDILQDDPKKFCITPERAFLVGKRVSITDLFSSEEQASALTIGPFTREQTAISRQFFAMASNSRAGNFYAKALLAADTLLCVTHNDNSANGTYQIDANAITLSFQQSYRDDKKECVVMDYYAPDAFNTAFLRATFLEESVHALQHFTGINNIFLKENSDYHRGYSALHTLATEAHAKTIAATIAADEVIEGDRAASTNINHASYDLQAAQQVLALYMTHGRDAVRRDASLLFPVFKAIMEDSEFIAGYALANADFFNQNVGTQEPSFTDFATTFDDIPGFSGRLISDALDTRKETFLSFIHAFDNTGEKETLRAQFAHNFSVDAAPLFPIPESASEPACLTPTQQAAVARLTR